MKAGDFFPFTLSSLMLFVHSQKDPFLRCHTFYFLGTFLYFLPSKPNRYWLACRSLHTEHGEQNPYFSEQDSRNLTLSILSDSI